VFNISNFLHLLHFNTNLNKLIVFLFSIHFAMKTFILTLQTTSKTADPVKKTGIAADKLQTSKPFFEQIIKTRTFSDYE